MLCEIPILYLTIKSAKLLATFTSQSVELMLLCLVILTGFFIRDQVT